MSKTVSQSKFKSFMILGGAGLVGTQVSRQVSRELHPEKVVVASLYQKDVREVVRELRKEFRSIKFVELWGNL
ncbi:MAG TPA: hypothetical protein VJX67_01060, partial [Blastocatellia bacterium]|nr:hypothetical protein [Blastocatellia bacterium]